jgi:hypothetical protein
MEWYVLVDLSCHVDERLVECVYRTVQATSRRHAMKRFKSSGYARELIRSDGSYKVGKALEMFPNVKAWELTRCELIDCELDGVK